eukprot:356064-Chlamydomonas_euryale.AAC.5
MVRQQQTLSTCMVLHLNASPDDMALVAMAERSRGMSSSNQLVHLCNIGQTFKRAIMIAFTLVACSSQCPNMVHRSPSGHEGREILTASTVS